MASPGTAAGDAGFFLADSLFVALAAALLVWVSWQSHRRQHRQFLRLWALGWGAYVLARGLTLVATGGTAPGLGFGAVVALSSAAQAAYYLHAALLLVCLMSLVGGRRLPLGGRAWVTITAVVLAVTGAVGYLSLRTEPALGVFLRVGLRCAVTAAAFLVCGAMLLRHGRRIGRTGAAFVGLALLAGAGSYALLAWAAASPALAEVAPYAGGFEVLVVCAIGFGLVLWIHEDIDAAAARTNDELAARTAALLQAQRLESIGQLAGGIAHDFNNVLTVVLAGTEAVLREPGLDAAARERLEEVRHASQHAAKMIGQLRTLGRDPQSGLSPIDVAAETRAILPLLQSLAGPRVAVTLRAPAAPLCALLRSGHVEQILINLVTNGRDAIAGAGAIHIEVARAGTGATARVVLSASDTGQGMTDAIRRRVGELFFTTKGGRGTGVGLASVRSILSGTDGRMEIDSAEGRGARVAVSWPEATAANAADAGPQAPPPAPPPAPAATATILFAEDDPMVRRVTGRTLKAAGYEVLLPNSSGEALEVARRHDGPIHLLLSDVVMPGLSGPQLAGRVRALRPDTAVRFISGHVDAEHFAQLPAESAVLPKPFTGPELLDFVQRALDGAAAGDRP